MWCQHQKRRDAACLSHQPAWGATNVALVAYSCACGKQVMWNYYHKGVFLCGEASDVGPVQQRCACASVMGN